MALFCASTLLALSACGPGDEATIETTRSLGADASFARADATSEERFTGRTSSHDGHNHAEGEHDAGQGTANDVPFLYQLPSGWTELASSSQRWINLQPEGNPDASCYLAILPGEAGGLAANANRWLGQLGIDPLDEAGVAALPTVLMLGQMATLVEGQGHFSGMGDQARDNWGLLGLIQTMRVPNASGEDSIFTAFVKMTGPADLIAKERANFETFYQSLKPRPEGQPAAAQPAPATSAGSSSGAMKYATPAGWTDVGASGMRLASLTIGDGTECYVIRLGGDGGGLAGNVNRWRGQLGLDPLDDAGIAALAKVPCLGTEAVLFDATGSYTGMNGEALSSARMLGALVFMPGVSYFVKLVGPTDVVAANVEPFKAFAASLEL